MHKLLYKLYEFSGDHQVDRFLAHESEELDGDEKMCTHALEQLKNNLSPEQWQWVDRYISGRDTILAIVTEAYFYSGLAMGFDLSRLTTA